MTHRPLGTFFGRRTFGDKPVAARSCIPKDKACVECGVRWRQSHDKLCRTCHRLKPPEQTQEEDNERLERRKAGLAPSLIAHAIQNRAPRRRVVEAERQLFEVVWSGDMDGPRR